MTAEIRGRGPVGPGRRVLIRARQALRHGLLPALPGLAVLVFLFLVPLAIMFVFSFWRTNNDFLVVPDWNLDNYARFFIEEPTCGRSSRR